MDGLGVNKDIDKALEFIEAGAISGEVNTQYNLGLLYKGNSDIPQDFKKSLYWLKKAALQDFAPAQVDLGIMLIKGDGTEVNEVEGFKWICVAYARNDERAEDLLNYCKNTMSSDKLEEGYNQAQLHVACAKTKNVLTSDELTTLKH